MIDHSDSHFLDLADRRKSSMIHLRTEVEKKPRNQLDVMIPETMKNIPSPDSFINNKINGLNILNPENGKDNKFIQGGLETINDDGSDFKSDRDFEENGGESHDFGMNLKNKKIKETQNSISIDSDDVGNSRTLMKQETLGVKINE